MDMTFPALIHSFADRHVVVIGEAMLDSYLMGSAKRLCQEAPVPVVTLNDRDDVPGGAANVAVNLQALGARVSLLSVVGEDADGERLQQVLEHRGIETAGLLMQPSRRTLVKKRVMAASQMLLRIDEGDTEAIAPEVEQHFIEWLCAVLPHCDAIVISDYSYGLLTPRVRDTIAALQVASPKWLVVDSKRLASYRSLGVTVVKPNYEEATHLLAGTAPLTESEIRFDYIARHGEQLLDRTGANLVIVTLDADGAILLQRHSPPQRIDAKAVTCRQTTGAGDTFLSALTLALASHAPVAIAAELAATAAAVVIAKEGTATCSAEELQAFLLKASKPHDWPHHAAPIGNHTTQREPSAQEVA